VITPHKRIESEHKMTAEQNNLDHPCKQTCSGWEHGYEEGLAERDALIDLALDALKSVDCDCLTSNHRSHCESKRARKAIEEIQKGRGRAI